MSEYIFIFSVGALLGAAVFWSGYFCAMRKTKNKWDARKTDDLYANSASIEFPFEMQGLKDCPNLEWISTEEWDTWRTARAEDVFPDLFDKKAAQEARE
jgi:hypothetical protein